MDTSEPYIKMCDCEEIQSQMGTDGDYYYWSVDDKVHISHTEQFEDYVVKHPEQWDYLSGRRVIWLPRQDQLQEIYNQGRFGLQTMCCFIYDFSTSQYGSGFTSDSMEQLWLAFVMKEKFNKTWDGNGWINK